MAPRVLHEPDTGQDSRYRPADGERNLKSDFSNSEQGNCLRQTTAAAFRISRQDTGAFCVFGILFAQAGDAIDLAGFRIGHCLLITQGIGDAAHGQIDGIKRRLNFHDGLGRLLADSII